MKRNIMTIGKEEEREREENKEGKRKWEIEREKRD